jgi:nicotinic acid mononucleotide adenylyltransferase
LLIAPRFNPGDKRVNSLGGDKVLDGKGEVQTGVQASSRGQAKLEEIEFPFVDISSSKIRSRIAAGRSVLYMVPRVVNDILLANGYYQRDACSYGG